MLFNPSREEVRLFFCSVFAKMQGQDPQRFAQAAGLLVDPEQAEDFSRLGLTASESLAGRLAMSPLEELASGWIALHPEYHGILSSPDGAQRDFPVEAGETNPFLHLAMHLSLEEQMSIDQPPGVRAALEQLISRLGDRHAAMHRAMDCLAEMIWQAQRNHSAPEAQDYLACLQQQGRTHPNA